MTSCACQGETCSYISGIIVTCLINPYPANVENMVSSW